MSLGEAAPEARLRVLRVITRLNIGGPARQALLLTRRLRPWFDTLLACGTAPRDEGELSDPEVAPARLPLVRPPSPVVDVRSLVGLRRLIAGGAPDVVHSHMAKAGTLARLAVATSHSRPVTVHTFHGHVLDGYFAGPVERAVIAAERRLARRTDAIVAVSPEVRDELLDLGIGEPRQYRVIPLGFDLSEHLAVDRPSGKLRSFLRLASDVPLVGVLGRLAPIKDHATLLEAVARIDGLHLAVLGDGELRADLESRATLPDLRGRVHFTGWWHDVPAALSDLDVVILTSRNEGTPVSLIEAGACARPVIATAVGGVRSVVRDGQTGLLAAAGDASALAEALRRLTNDPGLCASFGQAGRAYVRDRFDQERLVSDVRALYEELLDARSSP